MSFLTYTRKFPKSCSGSILYTQWFRQDAIKFDATTNTGQFMLTPQRNTAENTTLAAAPTFSR